MLVIVTLTLPYSPFAGSRETTLEGLTNMKILRLGIVYYLYSLFILPPCFIDQEQNG